MFIKVLLLCCFANIVFCKIVKVKSITYGEIVKHEVYEKFDEKPKPFPTSGEIEEIYELVNKLEATEPVKPTESAKEVVTTTTEKEDSAGEEDKEEEENITDSNVTEKPKPTEETETVTEKNNVPAENGESKGDEDYAYEDNEDNDNSEDKKQNTTTAKPLFTWG